MELALIETKIQAKKLLKSLPNDNALQQVLKKHLQKLAITKLDELKLKHCLTIVSQQLGFINWHQAQSVLSGDNKHADKINMGTFFYPQSCDSFINEWFSNYDQARELLIKKPKSKWLLPYKNQFLIVGQTYIEQFNLNAECLFLWRDIQHDMVRSYNTLAWDKLSCAVIKNRVKEY
jgi:hypothetical protein